MPLAVTMPVGHWQWHWHSNFKLKSESGGRPPVRAVEVQWQVLKFKFRSGQVTGTVHSESEPDSDSARGSPEEFKFLTLAGLASDTGTAPTTRTWSPAVPVTLSLTEQVDTASGS